VLFWLQICRVFEVALLGLFATNIATKSLILKGLGDILN